MVPPFIPACHVLEFACHFVACKVPEIHGFVADFGAVLRIRCTGKILIKYEQVLQHWMLCDSSRVSHPEYEALPISRLLSYMGV